MIARLKSKAWAFKEFAFPRKMKNERRRGEKHHRPCCTEHGILYSMMFYYCSADLPGSLAIPDRLPYVSLIKIDLVMIFILLCLSLIIGDSTKAESCAEPCATTQSYSLTLKSPPHLIAHLSTHCCSAFLAQAALKPPNPLRHQESLSTSLLHHLLSPL